MFAATVPRLLLTQIRFALPCFAGSSSRAWAEQQQQRQRQRTKQPKILSIHQSCMQSLTFFAPLAAPRSPFAAPYSLRFVSFVASPRLLLLLLLPGLPHRQPQFAVTLSLRSLSLSFSRSPSPQHNEACLVSGGGGESNWCNQSDCDANAAVAVNCDAFPLYMLACASLCLCLCVLVCACVCVVCMLHALCPPPPSHTVWPQHKVK